MGSAGVVGGGVGVGGSRGRCGEGKVGAGVGRWWGGGR